MSQGLCPSCGAAVNLTANQAQDRCAYCGSIVTRPDAEARVAEVKKTKAGGALLIANISLASAGYEKALSFYDKAIEQDEQSAEAWLGRGICLLRIEDDEHEFPRINATEATSSWDTAIQFANNPDAMGRRAAKVIAEEVSAGLEREDLAPRNGWQNFAYNDCDYNHLLGWAFDRDPKGDFLLNTGAKFYCRAAPYVELWAESVKSFDPSCTKLCAEVTANSDKFLKALREINPGAARQCEATFRKAQSTAQEQFNHAKKQQEGLQRLDRMLDEERDRTEKKIEKRLREIGADQRPGVAATAFSKPGLNASAELEKTVAEPEITQTELPDLTRHPKPPARKTSAKRIPTGLCAIFLGWLGVHKFMLGYTKEGFIQLVLGLLCCVGFFIGVVEGAIYLRKSDQDFARIYVQGERRWF